MTEREGVRGRLAGRARALWGRLQATGPGGTRSSGQGQGNTTQPMGGWTLRILVLYLMILFFGGGWVAWSLWIARPAAPLEIVWPETTQSVPVPEGAPTIDAVFPDTLTFGTGTTIRILGSGFAPTSNVLIEGDAHPGTRFIAPNQMIVELNDVDFRRSGTKAVSVTRDTFRSAPVAVYIQAESSVTVNWSPPLGEGRPLTVEARLMLLALLLGALGGTLASFNSLSSYRGEGKLVKSWALHYWLSPFLGGGVALLLYVVVRAGFLSGTNVQLDGSATQWGLIAVSGLAGLFYDKTLLKLREVFVTLFSPRDDRGGKLEDPIAGSVTGLAIVTSSLEPATKGVQYRTRLEVVGGTPAYSWSVQPELPGGLLLDPLTGVISGAPTEERASLEYEFAVRDMERAMAKATIAFEVH